MAYVWAGALVAVTSVVALLVTALTPVPDLEVLYLVTVILVAARWGRAPALLAAALGIACYDFLFVLPRYTFAVADARYVLTFAMMFSVGFVVSELTTRIRRQEQD